VAGQGRAGQGTWVLCHIILDFFVQAGSRGIGFLVG
jgi:hypothetical protein